MESKASIFCRTGDQHSELPVHIRLHIWNLAGKVKAGHGLAIRRFRHLNNIRIQTVPQTVDSIKKMACGGTVKGDAVDCQGIDGIHGLLWPQDVVVSKKGTQYNLSKQNYMLIIYNFT